MPNWRSRSDTEAWWSSQPGNRGKVYPGDDIAEKQYERNKAAGENNSSFFRNFFFGKSDARKRPVEDAVNNADVVDTPYGKQRMTKDAQREASEARVKPAPRQKPMAQLGGLDMGETGDYPEDSSGQVSLNEAKGGKIRLKDCKVSTHTKNKKQPNW
jgi:hypothetical protein